RPGTDSRLAPRGRAAETRSRPTTAGLDAAATAVRSQMTHPSRCRAGLPCWLRSDRKSTRLNSSHLVISYAVFCLKKKKQKKTQNSIANEKLDIIKLEQLPHSPPYIAPESNTTQNIFQNPSPTIPIHTTFHLNTIH